MKVLLVATNREQLPDPVFPLGVAYVARALELEGHEVECLDLCFVDSGEVDESLRRCIAQFDPEVIGLSIRNVDDVSYPQTTSYLELYQHLVRVCRTWSSVPLVLGGAGFTIMPREFLAALEADYGIVGEGEEAMGQLVGALARAGGRPLTELPPGVLSLSHPAEPAQRLSRWYARWPSWQHFEWAAYYERGGMLSLQTRRGCPHRCVYCTYPMIEGGVPRLRPVRDAVDELEALVEATGVRHFFLVDSVFNHPRDYAVEFCRELRQRRLQVAWTCYANAGAMDGELVEAMREAGCEGVEFGTDGLVDHVLEALGKGFGFEQVVETSRLCREAGLRFCHFVFLGAPDERPEDTGATIDRLAGLDADSSLIMVGIRIFPGTPLASRARAELGIERCGLEPVFYLSPAAVPRLDYWVERAVADHPSWVLPGYRRNYSQRIQQILRRAGRRGALWEQLSPR